MWTVTAGLTSPATCPAPCPTLPCLQVATTGVTVNAVCPGEIHTPMLEAGVKRSGRTIANLDKMVPYGRIGKPEEVAALVAFLASEEAPFMCGSLVEITGAQAVA